MRFGVFIFRLILIWVLAIIRYLPSSESNNYIKYIGDYMELKDLIETNLKIKFKEIKLNSQEVEKGDLFIPFPSRYNYIEDAIKKNCRLVITDKIYNHKKVYRQF